MPMIKFSFSYTDVDESQKTELKVKIKGTLDKAEFFKGLNNKPSPETSMNRYPIYMVFFFFRMPNLISVMDYQEME
jgi:hypothetical protein